MVYVANHLVLHELLSDVLDLSDALDHFVDRALDAMRAVLEAIGIINEIVSEISLLGLGHAIEVAKSSLEHCMQGEDDFLLVCSDRPLKVALFELL